MIMDNATDSILIFTSDQIKAPSSGVVRRRGVKNAINRTVEQGVKVAVNTLQDNMRRFLSNLDTIISTPTKEVGGLSLDEVEIHANIDSKGNVGIAGIVGAEFATQGGIKFVLRKKTQKD